MVVAKRLTSAAWACRRRGVHVAATLGMVVLLGGMATDGQRAAQGAFFDDLDDVDARRWERSNGWSNGTGFGCSWRADHVRFEDSVMTLVLDHARGRDHDLSCGEFRTHSYYHYGRYEVSMRAARGSGMISAFFIYTGPPFGDPWHETTIEILGRNTTQAQFTLFVDGEPYSATVDLGFDAAEGFHTYAIDWTPEAVRWYVDGRLMHTDDARNERLPSQPGRIYAHLWNADGLDEWSGKFEFDGRPITAAYDWVRFTPWQGSK